MPADSGTRGSIMAHREGQADSLIDFPCDYLFKAVGDDTLKGVFSRSVHAAVSSVVPVAMDAVKCRFSAQGNYVAVSVVVRLHNMQQVRDIYSALREIEGMKYLL